MRLMSAVLNPEDRLLIGPMKAASFFSFPYTRKRPTSAALVRILSPPPFPRMSTLSERTHGPSPKTPRLSPPPRHRMLPAGASLLLRGNAYPPPLGGMDPESSEACPFPHRSSFFPPPSQAMTIGARAFGLQIHTFFFPRMKDEIDKVPRSPPRP